MTRAQSPTAKKATMGLDTAIAKAEQLRDALANEVQRARGDRTLLRALDAAPLIESATQRAGFNALCARLQLEIAAELSLTADAHDLTEVSFASLSASSPESAALLALTFGEIRALAATLAKTDALNRSTAERALACVHGYLTAVALHPQAYDRRGTNLAKGGDQSTRSLRI
jgi:hypothetical protein